MVKTGWLICNNLNFCNNRRPFFNQLGEIFYRNFLFQFLNVSWKSAFWMSLSLTIVLTKRSRGEMLWSQERCFTKKVYMIFFYELLKCQDFHCFWLLEGKVLHKGAFGSDPPRYPLRGPGL